MIICSVLILPGLTSSSRQTDPNHDKWLQERYVEATSIKEGMTRADLLKVFRMDGGLQLHLPTRYVLKSSNLIKVDVEFDAMGGSEENLRSVPDDKLNIKRISKPYVEPGFLD